MVNYLSGVIRELDPRERKVPMPMTQPRSVENGLPTTTFKVELQVMETRSARVDILGLAHCLSELT